MVFHNGWNYDYDLIMEELAKEFEREFDLLGENIEKHKTGKYKTFPVPIENEVKRIDKNWEDITKTIYYKLQFIDGTRTMTSLISNLVDNLAEGILKINANMGM